MKGIVISGFPGIGKSHLFERSDLKVTDSDSSNFSWLDKAARVRHPDFPNNYMNHIKECLQEFDIILVSSHDEVRQALEANGIAYYLVYPLIELKEEYIQRYKLRGNDENFISFISSNWDKFISKMDQESFPTIVKLQAGEFLSDALDQIISDYKHNG